MLLQGKLQQLPKTPAVPTTGSAQAQRAGTSSPGAAGHRLDCPLVLGTGEATAPILRSVLGSPRQKRH